MHVLEACGERQYFFLAHITSWDPDRRSGPEFADPSRGQYVVEEVPLTSVAGIALQPEQIADLLAEHGAALFQTATRSSLRLDANSSDAPDGSAGRDR